MFQVFESIHFKPKSLLLSPNAGFLKPYWLHIYIYLGSFFWSAEVRRLGGMKLETYFTKMQVMRAFRTLGEVADTGEFRAECIQQDLDRLES